MDNNKSSDNSSCYESCNSEWINRFIKENKKPELILLALTCHEFTEQDVVTKAQKILTSDPKQAKYTTIFSRDIKLGGRFDKILDAKDVIEIKKQDGCFPASCAKLLDLIYQAREQVTQLNAQRKKEQQIRFEKEYQEMLANFIKK